MEQILVKSIMFYRNDDGSRVDYLDVKLSTNSPDEYFRIRLNSPITIVDTGDREKGETVCKSLTDGEQRVLLLVMSCCLDWLEGFEEESLDYKTLALIDNLAEIFDWEGAGYGPETEPGQRANELAIHIAEFLCIG